MHPVCFVLLTIRCMRKLWLTLGPAFVVRRAITWLCILQPSLHTHSERHGTSYEAQSYGLTTAYMVLPTYPSLPLTIP